MIPMVGKISVVARKLYNVILHSTANQISEYELATGGQVPASHYFEGRLVDLLTPIQSGQSDLRSKAKEYLGEMASIRVKWEAPDVKSDVLEDLDDVSDNDPDQDENDEYVDIALLSEVRLRKANPSNPNSEVLVRWALPPFIFKRLRDPQKYKYAQLSLYQITKLSTYESVALYEICSRYRTNPTGVTSSKEPLWWIKALSNKLPAIDPETGQPKWREWRKFKDEKIKKAVAEVCSETDLDIELMEKGGLVQFSVKRKASEFAPLPNKLNPEIADRALDLGLRPTDIATLLRNGQSEIGLKEALARMAKQDTTKIERKLAYLIKVLSEVNPLIADGVAMPTKEVYKGHPVPEAPRVEPLALARSYKDERRAEIRQEFTALDKDLQQPFAYQALAELREKKMANPSMSVKVEAKAWNAAPVLFAAMIDLYAEQKYGLNWGVEAA